MIPPDDPRICRTPFAEFNHLSLAAVAEFERLAKLPQEQRWRNPRYLSLLHRRDPGWQDRFRDGPEAA